jgi:hypothetical protein
MDTTRRRGPPAVSLRRARGSSPPPSCCGSPGPRRRRPRPSCAGSSSIPSRPPSATPPSASPSRSPGSSGRSSTAPDGGFQLTNVPFDTYELHVHRDGFAPSCGRWCSGRACRSRRRGHAADRGAGERRERLPRAGAARPRHGGHAAPGQHGAARAGAGGPSGSRGLEAVLVSFPGFAQNANGAIHPRGAHNQMTYLIDGLPISDQLTGAFANALDAGIVQTVELKTGNIPASFGRQGVGRGRRDDAQRPRDEPAARGGRHRRRWRASTRGRPRRRRAATGRVGYFGSVTAMRTDRFLDQISLDNLHNAGAFGRAFARVDRHPARRAGHAARQRDGRALAFEVANLRSQEAAGQDQRQALVRRRGWASYLRPLGAQSASSRRWATARRAPGCAERRRHAGHRGAGSRAGPR